MTIRVTKAKAAGLYDFHVWGVEPFAHPVQQLLRVRKMLVGFLLDEDIENKSKLYITSSPSIRLFIRAADLP